MFTNTLNLQRYGKIYEMQNNLRNIRCKWLAFNKKMCHEKHVAPSWHIQDIFIECL